MDYEEIIADLNSDIDNPETKKEAKELQDKLKKKSLILLILSSSILGLSFIGFIILLVIGLRSYNSTILFSIIPFVLMVLSTFGIFFGVGYNSLSKSIIINKETN